MNNYIRQIGNFLYQLLILLVLYSVSRIIFYYANTHVFGDNTPGELIRIFFYGIRFDYSAIIQYNLLFLILYLLPFNFVHNIWYKRIVGFLFYFVNFFFLMLNFADSEYFKFTGKRSTADLFSYLLLSDDILILLPQYLKDYWYVALLWIATVAGGIYIMKREPFKKPGNYTFDKKGWITAGCLFILIPAILFTFARGTGLKPIRIITAARYTESKNIPLLLNTPFTILHTLKEESVKEIVYFDSSRLEKIYTPEQQFTNKVRKDSLNVVIIILESFSKEFVGSLNGGKGYTPCLDSIMSKGLVFENAFANGKRSIEAVPALFAGLPAFMDDSYISTRFAGNKLSALPAILAKAGYHTSFFHGGRNGTMGFDEFSHIAGFQDYYGLDEYEGPDANDGTWGIYDEDFLQFYARKLNTFPQPFFSSVFTLSSHHPYRIPEKHKNDFKDTPNKVLRSIRYADYSLGKFFQTVSKEPWFKHTLFVFSADHTTADQKPEYGTRAGLFRIPIAYYNPGDPSLHGVSRRVTGQADVMPSVLDYLGISTPFLSFGSSVFEDSQHGFAATFLGGIYQYFQDDYLLLFDGNKSTGLYNYKTDKLLKKNLLKDSVNIVSGMELRLKAMIQQYNSRLLQNRMVAEK